MSAITSMWEWIPGWILTALNFGMEYPNGDEDDLFALGDDWHAAAAALRRLEPELRAVTDATRKYYTGEGAEQAQRELAMLFSGDHSIEETAKALDDLGRYTRKGGTDLEHTKIMEAVFAGITCYSVYQLLAAWPWGSAGVPLALAAGRTAVGIAAEQGAKRLALEAGATGLRTLLKPYLKQISITGLKMGAMGLGLDAGIQGYQLAAGHRDGGLDVGQLLHTGVTWAAGGLAAMPVGMGVNRLLGSRLTPTARGLISGVAGGTAGGVGMYGAGIGYQVAEQWVTHGHVDWSKVDTEFQWQMVGSGAMLGGAHGLRAGAAPHVEASTTGARDYATPTSSAPRGSGVVTEASNAAGIRAFKNVTREVHPDWRPPPERSRADAFFREATAIKADAQARGGYSDTQVARLEEMRREWHQRPPQDGSTAYTDSGARTADSGLRSAPADNPVAARPAEPAKPGTHPAPARTAPTPEMRAGPAETRVNAAAEAPVKATQPDRVSTSPDRVAAGESSPNSTGTSEGTKPRAGVATAAPVGERGTGVSAGQYELSAQTGRAGPAGGAHGPPENVPPVRNDAMEAREPAARPEAPTEAESPARYDSALDNGEGVIHRPEATSIGEDPQTHRVRENVRNEGEHDVVVHGSTDGAPVPSYGYKTHPEQIVAAVRNNPYYESGTPIRLLSCHSGNDVGYAQYIADRLGVPVRAPTDAVGTPRRPDSVAVIRGNGEWRTFHPVDTGVGVVAPRTGTQGSESAHVQPRSAFDDPPGWDYLGSEPELGRPPDSGYGELQRSTAFRKELTVAARESSAGTGRGVLEEIQQFALQRVLSRIFTDTPDVWVLKGGQGMLTRITGGRPSNDIDLVRVDEGGRAEMIRDYEAALARDHGDHLRFERESSMELDSGGVRMFHRAYVGDVQVMRLGIDLNPERSDMTTGEAFPMHRPPQIVDFPEQIFRTERMPPEPQLRVLSVEDTLAHKIAGMYTYGYRTLETKCDDCVFNRDLDVYSCQKAGSELPYRPQDMADVLLLALNSRFDGATVREILNSEFEWRRQQNVMLEIPERFELPNADWANWFAHQLPTTEALPFRTLNEALPLADRFLSPLFGAEPLPGIWDPRKQQWLPDGETVATAPEPRSEPADRSVAPVPGEGTGPRAPNVPDGVRPVETSGPVQEPGITVAPERIAEWDRLTRGPGREATVDGYIDRILAKDRFTVEDKVFALQRELNRFAETPAVVTGLDDKHLRFYVHQSGEEYIHALALVADPATTLEIAYQPLRAYTGASSDAHQSHIAHLGELPAGMKATEADAVAFRRWTQGASSQDVPQAQLVRELLELHAQPIRSALAIRERLITDYGLDPQRLRIVQAEEGRDPVYTSSRWLRAHLFTLAPIRDHPIETRAAIVESVLGTGPAAQERIAWVDSTVQRLLDAHENAGPKKYTLMWVRDTRPFGSRGAELDTRPEYVRQMVEMLRTRQPDRQIVFLGDDLFAGRPELYETWQRDGVLSGVDTTSLVEFWKPHRLTRAEQALFFHRLGTARDIVQIGMESGALETQTVLGIPTVYTSATEYGGNKANRWLHYSEPWQYGRTAPVTDESGTPLFDPDSGRPMRSFDHIGEQLKPPLRTIERVPVGPDLAGPVDRRQPVAVYWPAKVSVSASRIISLLETGQIDRWVDRLGHTVEYKAAEWTPWTERDWRASRQYAEQLNRWLHTEVTLPEQVAAKWDAIRLALKGVVEPGYSMDETAVTTAVVHPYFTLYNDSPAPAPIVERLAAAYGAESAARPRAVVEALKYLFETVDIGRSSVRDLSVFALDPAELQSLHEAIDRVVARNTIHPPVPYDAPPGGSAWDVPGAAAHSRFPQLDELRVPPYYHVHIFDGDGGGGHRFGAGSPGKTEFPQRWNDEIALGHIIDVARRPDRALFQANGYWNVIGARDDVTITVIVRPDGRIRAAWPEFGAGVHRNPR